MSKKKIGNAGLLCAALTLIGLVSFALGGCEDPTKGDDTSNLTGTSITAFKIGDVEGDIDEEAGTINITLPASQTDFTVALTVSEGAKVTPLEAEHNGVSVYRVTAGNGTTKDYTVNRIWLGASGLTLSGGPFYQDIKLSVSGEAVGSLGSWPDNVLRDIAPTQVLLTASDKSCDIYHWYVDGEPFFFYDTDAPSPTGYETKIQIGDDSYYLNAGNYSLGKHVLSLVAIKNGIPYTFSQVFTVTLPQQ
jgi:hypothetical protein